MQHAPCEATNLRLSRRRHFVFRLKGRHRVARSRDNKHMDFRLSIMKMHDSIRPSVVVSTLCMIHNKFGQYYLILHHSFSQIWSAQADGERACCAASLARRQVRAPLARSFSARWARCARPKSAAGLFNLKNRQITDIAARQLVPNCRHAAFPISPRKSSCP